MPAGSLEARDAARSAISSGWSHGIHVDVMGSHFHGITPGLSITVHDGPDNLHGRLAVAGGRHDRDIPGRAVGTPEVVAVSVILKTNL
jgi:hypothetical protein